MNGQQKCCGAKQIKDLSRANEISPFVRTPSLHVPFLHNIHNHGGSMQLHGQVMCWPQDLNSQFPVTANHCQNHHDTHASSYTTLINLFSYIFLIDMWTPTAEHKNVCPMMFIKVDRATLSSISQKWLTFLTKQSEY